MALTAIGLTTDLAGLRRTDIRPVVFDEAQWDEISRKPKYVFQTRPPTTTGLMLP